ncbi:hypothetical protein L484_022732 [Morus notabilis]|uniref:Uncharacterized protein n=1 Tax=Morus notabilis TaxID=981085 RepID=W9SCB9_9ROSA|nr:hypothetical protein L484_022732 [Morus notabilis]
MDVVGESCAGKTELGNFTGIGGHAGMYGRRGSFWAFEAQHPTRRAWARHQPQKAQSKPEHYGRYFMRCAPAPYGPSTCNMAATLRRAATSPRILQRHRVERRKAYSCGGDWLDRLNMSQWGRVCTGSARRGTHRVNEFEIAMGGFSHSHAALDHFSLHTTRPLTAGSGPAREEPRPGLGLREDPQAQLKHGPKLFRVVHGPAQARVGLGIRLGAAPRIRVSRLSLVVAEVTGAPPITSMASGSSKPASSSASDAPLGLGVARDFNANRERTRVNVDDETLK